MILSLTTSLSFLPCSTLCSPSTFFFNSTKYWLLDSLFSFSNFSTISLASFILCTPFNNYYLHWSMVLAEFSKEVEYSGNFLVLRQRESFLSKLFFQVVENCLLIQVISETYVYRDWSLTMRSSFSFLTSSSFSSAFFLKSTSRLCILSSISFFLPFSCSFSFSISSLSLLNVTIFSWISPKDFSMSSQIFCRFWASSSTDDLTVYWIFLIVY